jgi:hypothetical protein
MANARAAHAAEPDQDDEITIERRVRTSCVTTRMTKVDERLLAIARGEIEPDDPFGGLIPIYDDETWPAFDLEPEPPSAEEGMFGRKIPTLRMGPHALLHLPINPGNAYFIAQIDGTRSVEDLIALCGLDDLTGLEIIDELLRLGAIALG